MGNSARSDLIWSVSGFGVFTVSQMGVVLSMTRFAPMAEVGRYGFAISLCTIVIMFCNLGLRVAHSTDVARDGRLGAYLAVRIATTTFALVAILSITGLATVAGLMDGRTLAVIAMVSGAKAAESVCDLFYASFQKAGRLQFMAISLILRGPIGLLIFHYLLSTSGSLIIALAAQLITWWVVALGNDARHAHRLEPCRPRFDRAEITSIIRENLPLGFTALLTSIGTNSPRIIVTATLSLALAGIFTAVSYVGVIGATFSNSIGTAMMSRLARAFHSGKIVHYRLMVIRLTLAMGGLGLIAVAIAFTWGELILRLAFGAQLAQYEGLLLLLTIVVTLQMMAIALHQSLAAQRRFHTAAMLRLGTAISIIVCMTAGTLLDALNGAAIGLIVSSGMELIAVMYVTAQGTRLASHAVPAKAETSIMS